MRNVSDVVASSEAYNNIYRHSDPKSPRAGQIVAAMSIESVKGNGQSAPHRLESEGTPIWTLNYAVQWIHCVSGRMLRWSLVTLIAEQRNTPLALYPTLPSTIVGIIAILLVDRS